MVSHDEQTEQAIAIYRDFKDSLKEWPKTKLVKTNKYINKCIDNQLKRLKQYGLKIETNNNFTADMYNSEYHNSHSAEIVSSVKKAVLNLLNNSNQTFNNQSLYVHGTKITKFYKNDKLLKEIKLFNRLYVIVTSVNDEEKVLQHDVICPNCGNIVSMNELVNGTEGCCYCKTKFKSSDLYPVVTNYYHYLIKKEKHPFLKYYLITSLLFFYPIYMFALEICKKEQVSNSLIVGILTAVTISLIVAVPISLFIILTRQFLLLFLYNDGKSIKKSNYIKLENFIRQYDPNFTYYMFEGKMISMVKDVIFSKNPKDLVIYDCDKNIDFSNIIDVNFHELYINSTYLKDNKIYVDFTIEMNNTLYIKNKIKVKKQKFDIVVARNMDVYTVSNFRVDIINCKNCGASLDVEHDKNCKYCHTEYDYKNFDFVIETMSIK